MYCAEIITKTYRLAVSKLTVRCTAVDREGHVAS